MSETKSTWFKYMRLMREGKTVTCPFCGKKEMRSEGYGFRCGSCKKGVIAENHLNYISGMKNKREWKATMEAKKEEPPKMVYYST